jgi:nucleotide-binding universal stress UspA family protein
VVGLDERGGDDGLALGRVLATALGSQLVAVTVARPGRPIATRQDLEPEGIEHVVEDRAGTPAAVLGAAASTRSASVLVLGSSSRGRLGRTLLGGTARRILTGSPCPVAVAPRGFAGTDPGSPRVIAVGFDGRGESRAALALAVTLGSHAKAALRVVSVDEGPPSDLAIGSLGTPSPREELQEAQRGAVADLPAALRAEPRFRNGAAADVLLAECELGVDLLVVGSRCRGPLRAVLLGSVSGSLLERCACPVIVVPRPIGVVADGSEAP